MKKLFYFFVALLAVACSSGPDPGEVAAQAAKEYYTQLLVGQQKDERRGILDVRVVNAVADTTKRSANVFLIFAYGDSTSEEVVVPMVQHRGVWYMR